MRTKAFWTSLALAIALAAPASAAPLKQALLWNATVIADQAAVASSFVELQRKGGTVSGLLCKITSAFENTSCAGLDDPEECCTGAGTGTCQPEVQIDARVCRYSGDCGQYDVAVVADTSTSTNIEDWNFYAQPAALIGLGLQYQATGLADNPSDSILTCALLFAE